MNNHRIVSHETLDSPTVAGEFYVSGLGYVTLTEPELDEWRAGGFQMRIRLVEASAVTENTYRWKFFGWEPESEYGRAE